MADQLSHTLLSLETHVWCVHVCLVCSGLSLSTCYASEYISGPDQIPLLYFNSILGPVSAHAHTHKHTNLVSMVIRVPAGKSYAAVHFALQPGEVRLMFGFSSQQLQLNTVHVGHTLCLTLPKIEI